MGGEAAENSTEQGVSEHGHPLDAPAGTVEAGGKDAQVAAAGATAADAEAESDAEMATDG